ncbi:hypothetical protein HJFPF1_06362 [Paramyrothecium foliicola]|nr:hypothetical protein HJFPF1_06362 [Paramyrothecium foliicola]
MTSNPNSDLSGRRIRQRVSRWLNRALPRSSNDPNDLSTAPEPLPTLRPRPITPSDSVPCHPQKQSAFFARLPPEIRRAILLYAFGNSTMHMDLSFDHPMLERADINPRGSRAHCGFSEQRDLSTPRKWTWRSCVCHRNLPWPPPPHNWWRYNWYRPDWDQCLKGNGLVCGPRYWLGEWPFKCRVGALGWLLSCRAAYHDGVDILYETNQFHLSGERLLTRLPDYILPTRLAQMSSFEAVLSLPVPGSVDTTGFRPSSATYSSLLTMLSQCTGVKKLHLCLLFPGLQAHNMDVDLSHILDAMDAFVITSKPDSVVLHIDADASGGLDVQARDIDKESTEVWRGQYSYQMWRCLDGYDATQARISKRMCLYPQVPAPLQDPASPELGRSLGYWIMEIERERPYECNMP